MKSSSSSSFAPTRKCIRKDITEHFIMTKRSYRDDVLYETVALPLCFFVVPISSEWAYFDHRRQLAIGL